MTNVEPLDHLSTYRFVMIVPQAAPILPLARLFKAYVTKSFFCFVSRRKGLQRTSWTLSCWPSNSYFVGSVNSYSWHHQFLATWPRGIEFSNCTWVVCSSFTFQEYLCIQLWEQQFEAAVLRTCFTETDNERTISKRMPHTWQQFSKCRPDRKSCFLMQMNSAFLNLNSFAR